MKYYIFIPLLICFVSCAANYKSRNCAYNYSVYIDKNIVIDKIELETAISSVLKQNRASIYNIEIIIYGYSSGKEVFSYAGDSSDNITIKTCPGRLEALVKIKRNNNLHDVIFIKATGNSKKEIVKNLANEIHMQFCY